MRVDAPLGAYVPAKTPASTLDARVKVVLLVLVTVGVFTAPSWGALALWCAVLALSLHAARMSLRSVLLSMRPVAVILTFTLLANLVSCDGSAAAVIGPVGYSIAGGLRGARAVVRIVLVVGFSLCVASSTTPVQIGDAVVRLFRPLARAGAPVARAGVALSLALRFIPLVSEELSRIRLAQRARGVRFEEGRMSDRVRAWASVFTPLVVGLFRRADAIADAMEARLFDGRSAVLPTPRALSARDRAVLAVGCAMVAAQGIAAIWF